MLWAFEEINRISTLLYLNDNRERNRGEHLERERKREKKIESNREMMALGNSEDDLKLVVLYDDFESSSPSSSSSSSVLLLCRICHEEEAESSTSMESPCACSGTLKFAHRGCIQRWCDEKGSIVCEICLQKFEPDYTVPPKLALLDIAVTIRGSLEVPRLNYESENAELIQDESECSPPYDTSAIVVRSVALIFMLVLLARHLIVVVANGDGHYPFTLVQVFLLRASGIILPFYFIMRIITAIQKGQRQHQLHLQRHRRENSQVQRAEDEEQSQLRIQIHS